MTIAIYFLVCEDMCDRGLRVMQLLTEGFNGLVVFISHCMDKYFLTL